MKGKLAASVAAFVFVTMASSCSSYVHTISTERRLTPQTGIDFALKSASVSFVEDNVKDSLFMAEVADNFALNLENEYFGGESAVELFDIKATEGADYSSRDTLLQLVMSTDSDVAILFDQPAFHPVNVKDTVLSFKVYVYDSLNEKVDTVRTFYCTKTLRNISTSAPKVGKLLADYFAPRWVSEDVSVYYFDTDDWITPADLAARFKWKEAMGKWIELTDTKNSLKRAIASYNIAVCCYMLGEYDYALKWLERADADGDVANVPALRRRVVNAIANQ